MIAKDILASLVVGKVLRLMELAEFEFTAPLRKNFQYQTEETDDTKLHNLQSIIHSTGKHIEYNSQTFLMVFLLELHILTRFFLSTS